MVACECMSQDWLILDDKFCMKHLILLTLLVFASCSGEMGADVNKNSPNIFDDIIPEANAGIVDEDGGCIAGFTQFTNYSNWAGEASGKACIKKIVITAEYDAGLGGIQNPDDMRSACDLIGHTFCWNRQIVQAIAQGVIPPSSNYRYASPWTSSSNEGLTSPSYLSTDGTIQHTIESSESSFPVDVYCCYR